MWFTSLYRWFRYPLTFTGQVFQRFQANQGTLLAGAMAYNALLSLVPLAILLLVALSQVVSEAQLLEVLHRYLEQLAPNKSDVILRQVHQFLEHRRVLGWTMVGTLLFFSAAAFNVLQSAMRVIFAHRDKVHTRGIVTTVLLPYLYVLLVGFGLLAVTLLNGMMQTWATSGIHLFNWEWLPNKMIVSTFYVISLLGQVGGLTLIYMLMPAGRLPWRHALIGSVAASLLWEGTRYVLVWHFANLSEVNTIYGSLAGVIIVLMSLYAISLIILLGAQVIAEYERRLPQFSEAADQ